MSTRELTGGQITLLRRCLQSECRRLLEVKRTMILAAGKPRKKDDQGLLAKTCREIDATIKANDDLAEYLLKGETS